MQPLFVNLPTKAKQPRFREEGRQKHTHTQQVSLLICTQDTLQFPKQLLSLVLTDNSDSK